MKMIMTVMSKKAGERVLNALVNAGHMATYGETRGGMLRQSQLSIFLAVNDDKVQDVLDIIETSCKSQSVVHNLQQNPFGIPQIDADSFEMGGAVSFIWTLDRIAKC